MCFTDALAFDTTYRTNAFNKLLVIFVGVNNHFHTCVFGFSLLMNETIDTHMWVLEAFLECMQKRTPKVVITDGDTSMKVAITKCFLDAVHRLCGWHLSTNATTNIKSPQFTKAFRNLLYKHYNIPRWYEKWEALLDKFELHTNAWVDTTYANRFSWAETFLKTHFFGRMTTTQRCESINSYLKNFVNCKLPLREFIRHVDIALWNIRQTEKYNDFISFNTEPPYPPDAPLISYMKQFGSSYTRQLYHIVKLEINMESRYIVIGHELEAQSNTFKLRKFRFPDSDYTVIHSPSDNHLQCNCLQFESNGIPCRHIFTVMKHIDLQNVPHSLITRRFTKRAKEGVFETVVPPTYHAVLEILHMSRLGTLNGIATQMNSLASQVD
ncbi:hypothetical protein UlMin_038541 [Ulmus minor]